MEQPEIVQDSEVENTAPESTEANATETENEADNTDTGENGATDEDAELDVDGEKIVLPKRLAEKLKAERMMQADYTRKTQEAAELRKQAEAQIAEAKKVAEEQQQYLNEYAEAMAVNRQINQLQQAWSQLVDTDPAEAMKIDRQIRQLQGYGAQLAQTVTQKQQQQALARQQEIAKSLQEGRAALERDIPNWSSETAKQVTQYMSGLGAKPQSLESVTDPAFIKAFYKAQLYDQLVAKQATKPKPEAQEKPVTRISAAKSATQKDPDKMSADEWLKWRTAQVKRR